MTLRHRSRLIGLGERLRRARLAAGLSPEAVGKALGKADGQPVLRLERGRAGADAAAIERIAAVLGAAPARLAFGVDLPGGSAAQTGARIKAAREARGLTLADLSKQLGYASKSSLGHLEAGDRPLNLDLAERLGIALGCPPEWLCFGVLPPADAAARAEAALTDRPQTLRHLAEVTLLDEEALRAALDALIAAGKAQHSARGYQQAVPQAD